MVFTKKFSEFTDAGDLEPNQITVGLNDSDNAQFNNPFPLLPPGTTGDRPAPAPSMYYRLRFNTTDQNYEYYSPVELAWIQIGDSGDLGDIPALIYKAYIPATSAFNLGTLSSGVLSQTVTAGIATLDASYSPQMSSIRDLNGNTIFQFVPILNAVNSLATSNTPTAQTPVLAVAGPDANISLGINAKALGIFDFRTEAVINQIAYRVGPLNQHTTFFNFPSSLAARIVTWQDADGTVAYLSDVLDITWNNVTGTSAAMLSHHGYKANNAALVSLSLPTTSVFGDQINIMGFGAGGWVITQGVGQSIIIGSVSSTAGIGGQVASTNQFDSVVLICMEDNLTWQSLGGPQGTLNIT